MKSLHFVLTGLSLSTLAFVLPACSDDSKSSTGNPQTGSGGSDAGAATGGSENGGSASGGKGGSATGGGGSGNGGSAGSGTGGSGTGGSETTDGGETYPDGSAPSPACEKYCTDSLALCTGANAQFANEDECQAACKDYKSGSATGDTIECRQTHLDFITAGQPASTHCKHTGKVPQEYCQP
ncbi:MAG TPA: hypothetical protein VHE30_03690 [Polyangiaceae bacterium]|nr:hypothetical protein [Polyangiaceae bacterium]